MDFLSNTYENKIWDKLIDLNVAIIQYIMEELGISTKILFESELKTNNASTERILEICKKLGADTYLSGSGGRDYLDVDRFLTESIKLEYQDYTHPVYEKVFTGDFVSHLSIIDLLFNKGPESKEILGLQDKR